ncbi:MAG TPA: EAL domain-containing protein [Solirubrobacteraceae bacterium]|nr:EAL domain-containing protein [Solirubrobacteraceae bacterium]
MIAQHMPAQGGGAALDALIDAAAGILAADSLEDTLARIAHHLRALLPYDDLTVYEVDADETRLRPVFAMGSWVEEIMAQTLAVDHGTTGWVVRNRRTRNVPNVRFDTISTVVPGTDNDDEAFVCVPMLAHDRVVGTLNVYRVGAGREYTDAEVALVERFATMAALAYDSARQREHLRHQAATDGLTGLLNHRGAQERLRREIETAAASGAPLSVVVVDLDHFKRINDSLGHAEGDKVLAAAAAKLRAVVREGDAVGRLGGEEFVLVLPGVCGDVAAEAAERARTALGQVFVGRGRVESSAGVATYPEDAREAAELLAHADAALYAAKHAGRRQTRRYAPNLAARPSRSDERGEVEALLRRGADAIRPVFQPVLELATGRVCGYEALARIDGDPVRRPDQWFAQAHRAGLGAELEALALRAALAVADRPAGTFLALNVSPRALLAPPVADVLPDDLSGYVIELTEHEMFAAESELEAKLAELRERGARVALDDAGAGYAGLQQLIRVAPEILKIDRSLVHGAHNDSFRYALLEALVSFASTTGAAVCGEGVEDLDDLRALADLDATYAQGYALARPADAWAALSPEVAATAELRTGVRVSNATAAGSGAVWARILAELGDDLADVTNTRQLATMGRRAARLLGAEDVSLMWVVDDCLELLSDNVDAPGERWALADFPATARLLEEHSPGQIVVGDSESDPTELAELERLGYGAVLMVPVRVGSGQRALVEVYREHPQAFTSAEIDRARVVAQQFGPVLARLATT